MICASVWVFFSVALPSRSFRAFRAGFPVLTCCGHLQAIKQQSADQYLKPALTSTLCQTVCYPMVVARELGNSGQLLTCSSLTDTRLSRLLIWKESAGSAPSPGNTHGSHICPTFCPPLTSGSLNTPSSLFLGHSLGYPPQALVLPARQISTFSVIIRHLAVISCSSSYLPLILLSVAVTPEKLT